MKLSKARGLGRGLSALLNDTSAPTTVGIHENYSTTSDNINMIDINQIVANPNQPRKDFEYESLLDLSDSIKSHGIIQPIIVNETAEPGKYEIVAGERRWRAANMAKLTEVPVIIKNLNSKQVLEIGLIENIQRQELNIIEEAEGYKRLIEEFKFTQDSLSKVLGKSRSHIANFLRLNSLSNKVKDSLIQKKITMGHAKSLVVLDHKIANKTVEVIINKNLNVRQTEKYVKQLRDNTNNEEDRAPCIKPNHESHDLHLLAEYLSEKLVTKVTVDNANNMGRITIFFNDFEKLDEILSKIS